MILRPARFRNHAKIIAGFTGIFFNHPQSLRFLPIPFWHQTEHANNCKGIRSAERVWDRRPTIF
jgi:hypothetical protein